MPWKNINSYMTLSFLRPPLALLICLFSLSFALAKQANFSWQNFPWHSTLDRDHPLVGKIWSVKQQKFITSDNLIQQLKNQPYIGLGEVHDNPDHHILQAWIIQQITAQSNRKPTIVLEMITQDKQPVLERFLQKDNPKAQDLGTALNWKKSGWPQWSLYQPIAEVALKAGLTLQAGNPTKQLGKKVAKKGYLILGRKQQSTLHLQHSLPKLLSDDLGKQIVSAHCNMIPATATTPMVRIQRLRDAIMAQNLLKTPPPKGAILIAGGGHVRRDRGVPWYIRQSGETMISVLMAEAEEGADTPPDLVSKVPTGYKIADYIWVTPRQERPDPCEQFKKFMKRKKHKTLPRN